MQLIRGVCNKQAVGLSVICHPTDYVRVLDDEYNRIPKDSLELPVWEDEDGMYDVIVEGGWVGYCYGESVKIVGYDEARRTVTLQNDLAGEGPEGLVFTIPYEQFERHFTAGYDANGNYLDGLALTTI